MKNRYEIRGDVLVIFIERDGRTIEALADAEDFGKIAAIDAQWWLTHQGYVKSSVNPQINLHRLVMDAPAGLDVDHVHHVRHDNRKSELRCTTRSINCHNRRKPARNIYWIKKIGKWRIRFLVDGVCHFFGVHSDIREAEKIVKKIRAKLVAGEKIEGIKGSVSGVKGVVQDKTRGGWRVYVPAAKGKFTTIGRYRELDAAVARLREYQNQQAA